MIRFVKHKDIDKNKWDECIKSSFNSIIYAYSWYLDIVTRNHWDAFITGDYNAVMPLPSKKKFGVKYLYQPLFTQQLGVFSKDYDENLIQEFVNGIIKKFRFAEYNFNVGNILNTISQNLIKNINLELNLKKRYSEISSAYSQNHKRNIKKAKENNIIITYNTEVNDIIDLFRNGRGAEIKSFNNHSYFTLEELIRTLRRKNLISAAGAYSPNENQPICGVIFLKDKERQIFFFSGNNEVSKESGAMHLLVDSFIEQCTGFCQTLDFEGSNNENLARFYRGFGAEEKYYYSIRVNNLPALTKRFLYLYKKFRY
jgi:hypothetical protein